MTKPWNPVIRPKELKVYQNELDLIVKALDFYADHQTDGSAPSIHDLARAFEGVK